jgi:hypothetical protein
MVTFADILLRYEEGETTRAEALRELKEFGLMESHAREALGLAEEDVTGLCLVRSLSEPAMAFEEVSGG